MLDRTRTVGLEAQDDLDRSMIDDATHRAAWRGRLARAVLNRDFDDEVLLAMLMAGFDQARTEGLLDAAEICQLATKVPSAARVASVLEKAIRQLERRDARMNKDDRREIRGLDRAIAKIDATLAD